MEKANKTITLLNGTVLPCYPATKLCKIPAYDEGLQLDTTGKYLVIGRRKPNADQPLTAEQQKRKEEKHRQSKLFIDNVYLFLDNVDTIFADSRMFLARVPQLNCLAYTGVSGFVNPTLGGYLEWWLNSGAYCRKDEEGREGVLYSIAGSPLSGSNTCQRIYRDGTDSSVSIHNFSKAWQDFHNIQCRYSEAKYCCDAYTLQEVCDILRASRNGGESTMEVLQAVMEGKVRRMTTDVAELLGTYAATESACKRVFEQLGRQMNGNANLNGTLAVESVEELLAMATSTLDALCADNSLGTVGKLYVLQSLYEHLCGLYRHIADLYEGLLPEYRKACVDLHYMEMYGFVREYSQRSHTAQDEQEDIRAQRADFKGMFKSGAIDQSTYQQLLAPLNARRRQLERDLDTFYDDGVNDLVKSGDVTYTMIKKCLKEMHIVID